jgi:exodeoxyribonuclease VII large subunit
MQKATVARLVQLKLRAFRDEEAKRQGVESYRVLHNETIDLIAQAAPTTNIELLTIKGIGPAKAKRYGSQIFRILEEAQSAAVEPPPLAVRPTREEKVYQVGEFLDVLNTALATKAVSVRGEVTQVTKRGSNYYFTIKDPVEEAVLECFVRGYMLETGIELVDGIEVVLTGFPSVYKKYGRFSLTVTELLLTGEGELKKAFERLKAKLEAEGLFAPHHKKTLPRFIQHIGLITADGSAALRDVCTHIAPYGLSIECYDVRVEGPRAVSQVCQAVTWFNQRRPDLDVIIICRGGGSLESLQAFNSEPVARAIFASKIPIVCGVGHEVDTCIADLVCDVRASTPTDAGKRICADWEQAEQALAAQAELLDRGVWQKIQQAERILMQQEGSLAEGIHREIGHVHRQLHRSTERLAYSFESIFAAFQQASSSFRRSIDNLRNRLGATERELEQRRQTLSHVTRTYVSQMYRQLKSAADQLMAVDPSLKLKQGYSIIFDEAGRLVRRVQDVGIGSSLSARVAGGSLDVRVEKIAEIEDDSR